jgi:predicted ATPase
VDDDFELLAELLSLPNAAADLYLSPRLKRERLFEALLRQLAGLTRTGAVLAVFEDVHWIDPTSREMLDLLVERVRSLPVLLIVTFRPEFRAPWADRPHVTNLALNRLGEREVATLVHEIAGNIAISADLIGEIVDRTDGVPLFIEELTKAVLEQGQATRMAALLAASPSPGLAVPPTLQASLVARLDRIGTGAREIAQIGAVLGREFSYELIEPVAQRPAPALCAGLAQLDDAGLLFCRGMAPESSYRFKHALVQDAAYGTLLRARRQELHARVAAVLERDFLDLVERQPELLAHHLTAAGDTERAVDQWLKAGSLASGRQTHVEAIAHMQRGLSLLATQPETPERDAREIELQLALGSSSVVAVGNESQEVTNAYRRACELAERLGDDRQLFEALFGSWAGNQGAGRVRAALADLPRLSRVADRVDDDGLQLQAHHAAWSTLRSTGPLIDALRHTELGRALYDPERHRSHRLIYGGHDPGVCSHMVGGITGWLLGYPDRARWNISQGLALAEHIAHPFSSIVAYEFSALVHLHCGESERVQPLVAKAEALRVDQRLSTVFRPGFLLGGVELMRGATADAIVHIRAALAQVQATGTPGSPYGRHLLAQALTQRGDYAEALAALSDAFVQVEATNHREWEADLHRVKGLVLLAQGERDAGEASLARALQVARQQHAKSLELRAAMSLAKHWDGHGRRSEAVDLLAPIYGWFTEGFDTQDLKDAKALLDELA